jgi:hypothetical protein
MSPHPSFDYSKEVCTDARQQRETTNLFQLVLCESNQEAPDLSSNDVQVIGEA